MRRRGLSPFSLSFLDIMFCGFGAVVLLVLIINTDTVQARKDVFADLRGEVVQLENRIIIGRENQLVIRNSLHATDRDLVLTQGDAEHVQSSMLEIEAGLTDMDLATSASLSHINELKSDLKALDKQTKALAEEQQARLEQADKVHEFAGEGDRQYLTGLKLGGKRILILVDASASMLDESIVNVIRLRHQDDTAKRAAEKWQRAQNTAEWLLANLPQNTRFQLQLFNTQSQSAAQTGGWLSTSDAQQMNEVVSALRDTIPQGGTSLYHAFKAAAGLSPKPDNIILITDGLPTQGRKKPTRTTVSSEQRLEHFYRAIKLLPDSIPVNTILLPMEGDMYAAAAYWQLAVDTRGAFLTPARDWP